MSCLNLLNILCFEFFRSTVVILFCIAPNKEATWSKSSVHRGQAFQLPLSIQFEGNFHLLIYLQYWQIDKAPYIFQNWNFVWYIKQYEIFKYILIIQSNRYTLIYLVSYFRFSWLSVGDEVEYHFEVCRTTH